MFDFLTLKSEAFGLDISDASLKIAKLEKKRGRLKLVSHGETFIREGLVRNGEIKNKEMLVKTIKKAISEVKGEKLKTKYVIVSLPEEKAFMEAIQMPQIPEEDLKSAVVYEAENHIPMPIEEVCLDSQIIPAISNHLDHQDVLLVAFPKKIIEFYTECLKESGLKPIVFEIESLATSRSLIKDEVSSYPILIIDFGATTTSFVIFSGYSVRYTFSLPFSSQKLTEDIARFLKIDLDKAEKLKTKIGLEFKNSKDDKEIQCALEKTSNELIGEIKKHIDYYYSHISHEHLPGKERGIKKILLCGGGANLKGLDDFLFRELSLPVEFGNPWVNILSEKKKEKASLSLEESLKHATSLGLALRGVKDK